MIFFRSPAAEAHGGPALSTLRVLTLVSLAAYPAGGLILALGPDGSGGLYMFEAVGLALVTLSLIAAAPVLGSRLQRIVGEETGKLDEFELQLRYRAISSAYAALSVLACLAMLYAALASDFGWWLPKGYDSFNAVFWGVFLYVSLLPTAFLAWRLDGTDPAEA
jgi:hypothetical protein